MVGSGRPGLKDGAGSVLGPPDGSGKNQSGWQESSPHASAANATNRTTL